MAATVGARRGYAGEQPPAFLYFEYVTGLLVREAQVVIIRRFLEAALAGRSRASL